MGVVIKQSFWGSALAYLGVFLGFFNTIVLRPAYLDMEQIGLLSTVVNNALTFAPFATLGMPATYVRYFPYLREDERLNRQFFTFQFFLILLACLFCGVLVAGGLDWINAYYSGESSIYQEYILITFLIFICHTFYLQISAYSRVYLDVVTPYMLKEVQLRIGNMVLILMYGLHWINFEWSVKLLVINYLLSFGFNLLHVMIRHRMHFTRTFLQLPREWIQKMYNFGGYNLLLAGSTSIFNNVSFLMLPALMDLGSNGVYSICFYIGIVIEMPKRSMGQIISPIFANEFKNENMENVQDLYHKSSLTLSVIACLFFIGILCNVNDLFTFIPRGDELVSGFWVVIIIALAKLVDLTYGFNSEILIYTRHYKYNLYMLLLTAVLTVVLNYVFVIQLGITGAALAYLATTLFFNVTKHYLLKTRMHMTPFSKSHLLLALVTLLIAGLFWYLPLTGSPLLNILLRSLLIAVIYMVVVYKLNISQDVNRLIQNLAKKFLKITL